VPSSGAVDCVGRYRRELPHQELPLNCQSLVSTCLVRLQHPTWCLAVHRCGNTSGLSGRTFACLAIGAKRSTSSVMLVHVVFTNELKSLATVAVVETGTALAVMAIATGVDPSDAVDWVRGSYHPKAVETPWQRKWIERDVPRLLSR
jgi:hypothetical protein